MAAIFDRIVFSVPNLPAAVEEYEHLFGRQPRVTELARGESAAQWALFNTVIELVQGEADSPRLQSIVFASPEASSEERPVTNSLGIDIRLCDGAASSAVRGKLTTEQGSGPAVDHLVLRTDDAPACIELFSGELGIRLALDKTVPEWGGRMLFFRAGKLTLEVIESDTDAASGSVIWGLAYQYPDLAEFVAQLAARGVETSAIRAGRKPGTLVSTLKSHNLKIPTLLIQPVK